MLVWIILAKYINVTHRVGGGFENGSQQTAVQVHSPFGGKSLCCLGIKYHLKQRKFYQKPGEINTLPGKQFYEVERSSQILLKMCYLSSPI